MKNHWEFFFNTKSSEMSQCDPIKIDIEKWTGNVCFFFAFAILFDNTTSEMSERKMLFFNDSFSVWLDFNDICNQKPFIHSQFGDERALKAWFFVEKSYCHTANY